LVPPLGPVGQPDGAPGPAGMRMPEVIVSAINVKVTRSREDNRCQALSTVNANENANIRRQGGPRRPEAVARAAERDTPKLRDCYLRPIVTVRCRTARQCGRDRRGLVSPAAGIAQLAAAMGPGRCRTELE
jgi:hypothetical protein